MRTLFHKDMRQAKYFLVAAVFGFLAVFGAGSIHAQQSASLKIEGDFRDQQVDPGSTFSGVIRATNEGTITQTYYVVVKDIESVRADGQPNFSTGKEKTGYELSSWVTFPGEAITIAPGGKIEVPYTVQVPKDATPGGHFGAIFLSTETKKPETNGAAVGFQVGTILSFQISGAVTEKAEIREFSSDSSLYGSTDVKFKIKVQNSGNSLARPRGIVEIRDMFDKKIAVINLNEEEKGVFPNSSREFEVLWKDDKIHMGKYVAIASMTYGYSVKQTIFSETSFWIFPSKIVIPALGFIFAVALILYIWVKIYIKKKMKEYGVTEQTVKPSHQGEFNSKASVMFIAFVGFVVVFALVMLALFA